MIDLKPSGFTERYEYRTVKPGGRFTAELDALYEAGWTFHMACNAGVTVKRERPASPLAAPTPSGRTSRE